MFYLQAVKTREKALARAKVKCWLGGFSLPTSNVGAVCSPHTDQSRWGSLIAAQASCRLGPAAKSKSSSLASRPGCHLLTKGLNLAGPEFPPLRPGRGDEVRRGGRCSREQPPPRLLGCCGSFQQDSSCLGASGSAQVLRPQRIYWCLCVCVSVCVGVMTVTIPVEMVSKNQPDTVTVHTAGQPPQPRAKGSRVVLFG